MDGNRFDALARTFGAHRSRRSVVKALGAAALGVLVTSRRVAAQVPTDCTGLADGTPCDDGNACTMNDVCQGGICHGTAVQCPDTPCHSVGTCDPPTGVCWYTPEADGAACDAGDTCTTGDTCQDGLCVAGTPSYDMAFLPPLDGSTSGTIVLNRAKNGRVVPVKVAVTGCAGPLTGDNTAEGRLTIRVSRLGSCEAGVVESLETYVDAGASSAGTDAFRWADDAWLYNFDLKALGLDAGSCYRLDVLLDGQPISGDAFAVIQAV